MLLNLLSNAFKFTPSGGRIRCALERSGDDRALLSVQDSGPGVPVPMRAAIFERFHQGQQGTTRDFGGTGLGLAIAKEFVELHHGSIGVTSAPGGGALFQVEIPLKAPSGTYVASRPGLGTDIDAEAATDGVIAELMPEEIASTVEARTLDRPTVLVVEDNPQMRSFVREALSADYRVVTAADGRIALNRAMADVPDLVVTDLMMPSLGGDRLVDAMRAEPALEDVQIGRAHV